jgi:glycylpeptide N-tetradecanoyltransferase
MLATFCFVSHLDNLLQLFLYSILKYLQTLDLSPVFTEAQFKHWFLPRASVVDSYVVEQENGEITDFCSFYHFPIRILQNEQPHRTNYWAYSIYKVTTKTTPTTKTNSSL